MPRWKSFDDDADAFEILKLFNESGSYEFMEYGLLCGIRRRMLDGMPS